MSSEAISLTLVLVTLGMQILHSFWFNDHEVRSTVFLPRLKAVAIGGGTLTLTLLLRRTYLLYESWRLDGLERFFLPPYRSWAYFAGYAGSRFSAPWIIALFAGVIGAWAAARLNRRYGGRFFEREEPFLFGAAIFFSGYPVLLFYVMLLGAAAVLWVGFARGRGHARATLYFLWLPAAAVAIIGVYRFLSPDMLAQFNL
jgi:hypothetical protein